MVTRRKIYNKKYQIYCDHQDNGIIRTLVEFKIKHKSILKKFISQNKHDKIIIIINNCHQLIQSQPHETYEYFRKVQLKNHSGRLILVADNFQRLKMHVHHSQIEYKLEEKAKENKKVYNIQDKNNIILQGIFNYLRERLQKSQQLLKKALKSQTLFVPENELFLNPQLRYFPQVNEGRDNQIDQRQIVSYLQLQVALHKSSKILRFLTQLLWLININQQVELHLSKPKNTEILIVLKVQKQQNFQNKFQSQKDGHFLLSVQQFQLDDKFFNYLKQLIKINKLRQIEQKNYLKIKLSTKQHKIKPILLFQTLNKLTVIFGIANILDRQSLKKNNLQNELFNAYKLVKKANYFNKLKPLCPKNLLQILEIKIFILFYSLFNKLKEQNTKQIYHQLAKQGKLRLVFSKEKQQSKINLSDILKILERQFKKQHEQSIILQKIKSLNEVLKQSNNKNQTKSKDKLKNNCSTQEEIYKITSKLTKLLQYFGDIEFLVKKANQLLAEPLAESLQKIQSQQKQGQAHEIFFSQLQIHIYHLQGFNILSNLMKEIKIINQIFLSKQNQKQTKLILKNVCRLRGYFIKIDQKIDAFNKENSSLKFLKNYNQLLSQYCWSKLFIEKIYLLLENRHQRQTDVFLEMMEKLQLWEILQLQSLKGFYQQVIAFSTSYIDPKCHILVSQPISQFNKKNKKKQQKQQKQKNQRQSTYRFYNSLAYNIKETVEQKIDRFANISIQSLTLQKLINLPLENKKHALNVIFCDSLMPQHKEEEQKFQEKIQNQQIILQNQLGNFHVQRIDKILQKLKKRQLTQRQKKQSSQNNDQTVVNVLFGKNVEVLKTIVKKLFQKREKNIIITLNLSQKQPFSKGQGFKTNFIKTWQCFVQKQRSSYFFTQFFIKFYKNFFIQKLTTKYSLFQQSFYKAKKHAKQSLQAEFKSIFPQLKWKNIQFGIQGLQTAQKQLERSLVGNQKITPEKPSNIEFFHIKEIGLNQIISQSMKNLTKKMQEIIKSRQPFRNFVVVSQQKQVQDIESKSKYEQNLKIFVKSIFLMLIKQKKYVDKVSLQMNNSILQNYQKQQFFFNSQNQKKNLFQIEIIYDKILIEQKKDIHEKQKYYRQRFISSKGQPQKYLKIIVLNCLNISYKSYSGPQFKLESNQTQQLQFLFKIQWIGSIYHFCYPIFKLYKAQKISFDMKKWMKKFVNNSNYKYLLTTFNKQNAHYSLQYQHIVNTVFQQIIKENKIPNNKQKKNE